jgi:hypothetical protein
VNAPIVNGVCLSVSPRGIFCDRGEDGPHESHEGAWLVKEDDAYLDAGTRVWADSSGTIDPKTVRGKP